MNYKFIAAKDTIHIFMAKGAREYCFKAIMPKFYYDKHEPDVSELQTFVGKNPMGYGGPWNITISENPLNKDEVQLEWSCSLTCD
jgi:hypothetical protein